ncbi:hypothetical protein T4E_4977 [Trichinella pseudospiralis]|uniref:Uncharacterized protein n=1 Tax=Trichinella pseudospiralis TaxID=6337 RepID=A0A0V0Y558_TRIPS|nr:hypothetical protein T4E_4977 [Trichinella pseudospiralis]
MLVGVRCAVLVNWRFPEVFGETEIQDLQEGCKSIHFSVKNEEYKNDADDTKQIGDGTKQNKKRTRGICGSPWVPIL